MVRTTRRLALAGLVVLLTLLETVGGQQGNILTRLTSLEAKVADLEHKLLARHGSQAQGAEVYVSTKYGKIKGLSYHSSTDERYDVFYGIAYAKPPTGEHRFAPPRPESAWFPAIRDATQFGNICMQQYTDSYDEKPASEDCLNLNIYAPRPRLSVKPLPVMMFIHGGRFRDWGSPYYNFTNLALHDVIVVTINYRLDAFGFLSTEDDIIPGNYGLLDAKMALEFVKKIIGDFGGDPEDITLFGAGAGSAMVTQMALSPLTRGKFQKAIMQSGPGQLCHTQGTPIVPRQIAFQIGQKLKCPLPNGIGGKQGSRDLLACLTNATAEELIDAVHNVTVSDYNSAIIFVPVSGDHYGFLPEHPSELAAKTQEIVPIPMIFGWTSDDSSLYVPDPEDNGLTIEEFSTFIQGYLRTTYLPEDVGELYAQALTIYGMTNVSSLTPTEIRSAAVDLITDVTIRSFIVKEARLFSKAAVGTSAKVFVYEYHHRPSYSTNPRWQGTTHMDEEGMVLGLPQGPTGLSYPSTSVHDRHVSEMMTSMWSNFAKYGQPSPIWPQFGHTLHNQKMLLIRPNLLVSDFDRNDPVKLWTGSSGLD